MQLSATGTNIEVEILKKIRQYALRLDSANLKLIKLNPELPQMPAQVSMAQPAQQCQWTINGYLDRHCPRRSPCAPLYFTPFLLIMCFSQKPNLCIMQCAADEIEITKMVFPY